jgi:hypothetical protein
MEDIRYPKQFLSIGLSEDEDLLDDLYTDYSGAHPTSESIVYRGLFLRE